MTDGPAPPPPQRSLPTARPGLRGLVDRHRRSALALALLLIFACAAWLTWFYWPGPDLSPPTRAWYTVDDGATWFEDDAERIPPFDHEGKPAVRLHLYTCDNGKTMFVGYLQKLPDQTLQKYRDKGIDPATIDDDVLAAENGWLYKRRGDMEWVSNIDPSQSYRDVLAVRCPDGKGSPAEVFPKNPKKR